MSNIGQPPIVTASYLACSRVAAHAALRAWIFRRDNFTCLCCGWRPKAIPEEYDGRETLYGHRRNSCSDIRRRRGLANDLGNLVLDHIVARHIGGNHWTNLQTLCDACNNVKGSRETSYVRTAA